MDDTAFFVMMLVILVPALFAVMFTVTGQIADEFREGHRRVGFAMIATLAVIVGAVLPWWML